MSMIIGLLRILLNFTNVLNQLPEFFSTVKAQFFSALFSMSCLYEKTMSKVGKGIGIPP